MENKFIKYKLKYLDLKNKIGGSMDNIIVDAEKDNSSEKYKLLISFSNGYIYDYFEKRAYLLHNKLSDNIFKLLDIGGKKKDGTTEKKILRKFLVYENGLWKINNEDNTLIYRIINYQELPKKYYNVTNKKIVLFIRHAQSESNLKHDTSIINPILSDLGTKQSTELSEVLVNFDKFLKESINGSTFFSYNKGIELAIISPLKRTLLTAKPTLQRLNSIPIKESFLCTEGAYSLSDTGFSEVEDFINFFNEQELGRNLNIDKYEYRKWYNLLWKNLGDKNDDIVFNLRLKLFNDFIKSRNEKVIIVFTHSVFIKKYFEEILGITKSNYKNYKLGEFQTNMIDNTSFIPIFHE